MDRPDLLIAIARSEFETLFSPDTRAELAGLGNVTFGTGTSVELPDDVAERFDAVVTSWSTTTPDPKTLVGHKLRLAVHSGGSARRLFPRHLLDAGLKLSQPGAAAMAPAVAELALALTLDLLRHVHTYDRWFWTERVWLREPELGRSLSARQIGLVGMSRVGRHYLRLVQAFEPAPVRVYDPYLSDEQAEDLGCVRTGLDQLFSTCNVIAAHAPATPDTAGMINARQLAALPDGAVLINTARSAIFDTPALVAELTSGRLAAGLDVFDTEPLPADSPLLGLSNVILTPHVAGATREARWAQGDGVVAELHRFVAGQALQHAIDPHAYDSLA